MSRACLSWGGYATASMLRCEAHCGPARRAGFVTPSAGGMGRAQSARIGFCPCLQGGRDPTGKPRSRASDACPCHPAVGRPPKVSRTYRRQKRGDRAPSGSSTASCTAAPKGHRIIAGGGAQRNPRMADAPTSSPRMGRRNLRKVVARCRTAPPPLRGGRRLLHGQPRVTLRSTRGHVPRPCRGRPLALQYTRRPDAATMIEYEHESIGRFAADCGSGIRPRSDHIPGYEGQRAHEQHSNRTT